MSLMSSDIKLGPDVDPTVRRFQAAITRDLEQCFLLMTQGLGGFSNQSPGSISQDVNTNGMGVEANQGDYTFSGPASLAQLAAALAIDPNTFLQKNNDLSDVASNPAANYNLGVPFSLGTYTKTTYATVGSFTHTFAAGSTLYTAFIIAGGGGGAGGTTGTGSAKIAGGGGGGGASAIVSGRVNVASLAVEVGAAGTGGALDTNGVDGGDSSVTHGSAVINPHGGSKGGANGSSGAGGVIPSTSNAISADLVFFGFNGIRGGDGTVRSVTFNGAGAVSSYAVAGGSGGAPSFAFPGSAGGGGQGGTAGSVGIDGQKGSVIIYER